MLQFYTEMDNQIAKLSPIARCWYFHEINGPSDVSTLFRKSPGEAINAEGPPAANRKRKPIYAYNELGRKAKRRKLQEKKDNDESPPPLPRNVLQRRRENADADWEADQEREINHNHNQDPSDNIAEIAQDMDNSILVNRFLQDHEEKKEEEKKEEEKKQEEYPPYLDVHITTEEVRALVEQQRKEDRYIRTRFPEEWEYQPERMRQDAFYRAYNTLKDDQRRDLLIQRLQEQSCHRGRHQETAKFVLHSFITQPSSIGIFTQFCGPMFQQQEAALNHWIYQYTPQIMEMTKEVADDDTSLLPIDAFLGHYTELASFPADHEHFLRLWVMKRCITVETKSDNNSESKPEYVENVKEIWKWMSVNVKCGNRPPRTFIASHNQ